MPQGRHLSLREAFAQVFHAHGFIILSDLEELRASILALADPSLPETQLLVQELDDELIEPIRYLGTTTINVISLRYVRLEIAETLEDNRMASSELATIVADAIVGGFADSQGISFGDRQTSAARPRQSDVMRQELARERSQRAAKRKQSLAHVGKIAARQTQSALHALKTKVPRNAPWKLIVSLALTTLVVVIVSAVFVNLTQPSTNVVLSSSKKQSMWVVSQCTMDEEVDEGYEYDYDLGDYVRMTTSRHLVTSYDLDEHGAVVSLHQEGMGMSCDASFNVGKDGMPRSAAVTTRVESPDISADEVEDEEHAPQTATHQYSWSFDDMGRVFKVSIGGVSSGNAAVTYTYNSASDIEVRTEERDVADEDGDTYWLQDIKRYDEGGDLLSYDGVTIRSDNSSTQTSYQYDSVYDVQGRLQHSTVTSDDEVVAYEEYSYDQNGNLAQRVIVNEDEGRKTTYTYEYQLVHDPSLWVRQLQHIYPTIDAKLLV